MTGFESLLSVLVVAVLLAAIARRVGAPYPAFLALGGAGLAFIPGAPRFSIDPEVALALFVAPVLLDAAYDASPRDLKDNWVAVTSLAVVSVLLTTFAVAFVARALVPSMPWAAAIALGAIVSPPDAAAATAVLRQLRPPLGSPSGSRARHVGRRSSAGRPCSLLRSSPSSSSCRPCPDRRRLSPSCRLWL